MNEGLSIMNHAFLERLFLDQPVRSLQYMLRRLGLEYDTLPRPAVDGIFGEETLEAVMVFQREFHPPVTGSVDLGTWNAILALWQQMERRQGHSRALRAFPSGGHQVQPGEEREFLILPQTMFRLLSRRLEGVRAGRTDGLHDPVSAENVRWLQRSAGLEETGILDQEGWEMLSRLYEVFVVRDFEGKAAPFRGGWG